jgi:predicted metal-dependent hydrolase
MPWWKQETAVRGSLTRKISESGADSCYVRQVAVANDELDVIIKRSRRKTMVLYVSPDSPVELRVPMKCPWREIDAFLESRLGWIEKARRELANVPRIKKPRFIDGAVHDYLGSGYPLRLVRGKPNLVEQVQNALVVRCSKPESEVLIARHLNQWFRAQADRLFPLRIEKCLKLFSQPVPFRKLTTRKMKARWGSCSRNGEICLNLMLIQMPVTAIDFVIVHELCHLRHFAHNKSFYGLLSSVMPDWKEREKMLG